MPREIKEGGNPPTETDAMKAARLFMEGWPEMARERSIHAYGVEGQYVASGLFDAKIAGYNAGRKSAAQSRQPEDKPEASVESQPQPQIREIK